ncbi:MAG: aspartate aminotransferase family protein, partial [Thermoplasmata archaeon]|nr:aspartate aminotransferase family protein [Thermoplasmata archaeon]
GCGIGVTNAGHCPREVVKAVKDQVAKFNHLCFMVTPYEGYVRLAEKMAKIAPKPYLTKSAFFNSGAEAVENAVKYARHFNKKTAVFSFQHGFHGRTSMTMALTAKEMPYKAGFGPLPETYKLEFAYCYRCPLNLKYPSCAIACADKIDEVFSSPQFNGKVSSLVGEPIAGEGGFIVPPPEFYPKVSQICKKHNVILIADEIQTGAGRTGKMWCMQHWPTTEFDLLTSAKGIGGGMVISGVTGRAEIMDEPQIGGIGGTFGGHPASCAAALAQLEVNEKAIPKVEKINKYMTRRLKEMAKKYNVIGDVRGMGAMMAIELVKDRNTKEPSTDEIKKVRDYALKHGMVLLSCGTFGNIIRMHPALTMPRSLLVQAMDILDGGLAYATGKQ